MTGSVGSIGLVKAWAVAIGECWLCINPKTLCIVLYVLAFQQYDCVAYAILFSSLFSHTHTHTHTHTVFRVKLRQLTNSGWEITESREGNSDARQRKSYQKLETHLSFGKVAAWSKTLLFNQHVNSSCAYIKMKKTRKFLSCSTHCIYNAIIIVIRTSKT